MILRLLLTSLLLISWQVSAGSIKIPGTILSMTPPTGFTLSEDFTGFENRQTKSSIMIVEFPGTSYSVLAELFLDINVAKEQFDHQGVTILSRKDIVSNTDISKVLFLSGVQVYEGIEIGKYLALVEGDMTVLVSFNIFDGEVSPENIIIDSIKSIYLDE